MKEFFNLDASKICLSGFSQGSMMTCDLAFNYEVPAKALVLLSSTLVAKERLNSSLSRAKAKKAKKIPIFQSHGTGDPVLPLAMARKLKEILVEKEYKVDYHEFPGGHEIPPRILQSLIHFLKENIK